MYIHKSILVDYTINIRGKKREQIIHRHIQNRDNQWTHTNTQKTYITINLTKQHFIVTSLRETVQFMCEMNIKVNTQKIHDVKKKYT